MTENTSAKKGTFCFFDGWLAMLRTVRPKKQNVPFFDTALDR
jgi:hypothetical protein